MSLELMTPTRCLTGRVIEEWRPAPSQENYYEVSSLGRVRSRERRIVSAAGWSRVYPPRLLRPIAEPPPGGYRVVKLSLAGGARRARRVHGLVMEAFDGPRPEGLEVCHRNGNPADNRRVNLRYGTHQSNSLDALLHGTMKTGEQHHRAKYSDEVVREIRRAHAAGESSASIGRRLDVPPAYVTEVAAGRKRSAVP